jgi:hypothetical protein
VKYACIEENRGDVTVVKLCRWLAVSRSGYYKWRRRGTSDREMRKLAAEKALIATFTKFKARYGSPRLVRELNSDGIACSENHVAKLMTENGLKARNGKG